jgi:hypothetical protein
MPSILSLWKHGDSPDWANVENVSKRRVSPAQPGSLSDTLARIDGRSNESERKKNEKEVHYGEKTSEVVMDEEESCLASQFESC